MSVAVTRRVLKFFKQAFYKWRKAAVSQRDWDQAALINAALDVHNEDLSSGTHLIADELPAMGLKASENRVTRLFTSQQIFGRFGKRRGRRNKPSPAI